MLGHSMGTLCTFVWTSVQSAEAFRGVWGLLPQKILQPPRSVLRLYRISKLMANLCTVSVVLICDRHWYYSADNLIAYLHWWGTASTVARACAPVCPSCSLATPLVWGLATMLLFTIYSKPFIHCKNIWVTSTTFWSCQLHACCPSSCSSLLFSFSFLLLSLFSSFVSFVSQSSFSSSRLFFLSHFSLHFHSCLIFSQLLAS